MIRKLDCVFFHARNRWKMVFFFLKNFSTNQISRKNEIQLFDFFLIGIERPANTDTEKILLTSVVFSNSARKNFFSSKFFDQWEFEKKSNWILPLFLHWNRETTEHWCWKYSIDLCCILQIGEKNFFFIKIFRPIRIREKIKFNSSNFSALQSRDQWTLMHKKILLAFVAFLKSAKKKFFYQNFSTNQNWRKKSNSIISLFLDLNREMSEQWC